ncbi:aspartate aminotransferase family protein [Chakrabartyella piscis]|uniref:aspartate aminotransferase family protein n=1 Tax=Chakrabartyella piscis TaxID=2918914 RepID=UPI00295894D7|nr:aspartate aminotransferase family protein [Chakrabartyella piscis]
MTLETLMEVYKTRTKTSEKLHKEATQTLPGGIAANIKYYDPYPIFMESGSGATLTDVDGNEYIDYLASYGPLILGHGHPAVKQAITEHLEECGAILYGTPSQIEHTFAKKIMEYYPSVEMLRYTNSGTEATLLALRIAYGYTGKYKIGKFEGHYHGGYNQVLVSVNPPISEAGDIENPTPILESRGVEPSQLENTIILPFNDLESCTKILEKHQTELAAIIMEPILSGYVPATQEFMTGLREVTEKLGILLIFDEVKTGFRVGMKGAQGIYGIKPDITAMGKVIGAGMPLGIVGGRSDIIMTTAPISGSDVFDSSTSKTSSAQDVLFHSGTYNGHPLILKAGLATIAVLEQEFDHIVACTDLLKSGIQKLFADRGIKIVMVGEGTVFNYCITQLDEIKCYRDVQQSDFALRKKIDFALLNEGIYNKPTNRYSVSVCHDEAVVAKTLAAYERALEMVFHED